MINLSRLKTLRPKVGGTAFIAIDGRGGSGKSTLARVLSGKLGAEVILTDDFASWDNPLRWWPLAIERVFQPISNGARFLSYPRSHWWGNHRPEPAVDQPVTPLMILEGVGSSREELRSHLSFSIFVDAPGEICLERGLERDRATGKAREELLRLWEVWFKEEEEYLRRDHPKAYADIVVDGTRRFDQQMI